MPEARRPVPLAFRGVSRRLLADGLQPGGWARRLERAFHVLVPIPNHPTAAADVLVAGANPLLNALATLAAVRRGRSVLLAPTAAVDPWPYDVLDAPGFRRFVNVAAGLGEGPPVGLAPWATWLFAKVARAATAPGADVAILPRPCEVVVGSRLDAREALFWARRPGTTPPPPPAGGPRGALASAARVGLERALPSLSWGGPGLCVFASGAVLTSLCPLDAVERDDAASVDGEDIRFRAANPRVVPLGSARQQANRSGIAVQGAIHDVLAALGRDGDEPDIAEVTP